MNDVSIEYNGRYIHIVTSSKFAINPEEQTKLWNEIAKSCKENSCLKVFHEGPSPIRKMTTVDSFESGVMASEVVPGLRLAVFFPEYPADEITQFFKTVAFNRGVTVEFFTDRSEALRWLGVEENSTENKS